MKTSKPGKALNPALKAAVDGIYRHDPQLYSKLIRVIWKFQKEKWPDDAIAEACRMAVPGIFQVGDNYAGYLQVLLPKAKARATESESANHKKSDMGIAMEFVEFLKARQR